MQSLSVSIALASLLALPTFANPVAVGGLILAGPDPNVEPIGLPKALHFNEYGLWRPFDRARPRGRVGKRGNDMTPEDARHDLANPKVTQKGAAIRKGEIGSWRTFDRPRPRKHTQKREEDQSADVGDLIEFQGHALDSTSISLGAHRPKSASRTPANHNEEELEETN